MNRIYQGNGEWLIRAVEADHIDGTVRVDGVTETCVELDRAAGWARVRVGDERSPYRCRADRCLADGVVMTA